VAHGAAVKIFMLLNMGFAPYPESRLPVIP